MNKNIFIIILISMTSMLGHAVSLKELNESIKNTDNSIQITKKKMKEIGDVAFLPDLYFVLADLYHEKSRLLFEEARIKAPKKNVEELDLTASRKAKKMAIESYYRFTENYPKDPNQDKAFYNIALSYRELGQIEDMVEVLKKITKEFPNSSFWEESQLKLGDYFFEVKKEFELAIDIYQKILDRDGNTYAGLALYKIGWCYINLNKFDQALHSFENLLTTTNNMVNASAIDTSEKDIRRDALIAMVWPYTEIEKLPVEKQDAVNYFEKLSHDKVTLIQVFNRLGKRLLTKNRYKETTRIFGRLLEVQYELDALVQSANSFYESYKKSKTKYDLAKVTGVLLDTANNLKNAHYVESKNKLNGMNNLEIYARDFITELNKQAILEKKPELQNQVIDFYEKYFIAFAKNKYTSDMKTNLAELYFEQRKFDQAGILYEQIYTEKKDIKILQSAIRSYSESLKIEDKLTRLEIEEARSGYRDLGLAYMKLRPSDKAVVDIRFNIAKIYYDQRDFDKAIKEFKKFITDYRNSDKFKTAVNLVLDIYNQREDYDSLIAFGQSVVTSGGRNIASDSGFTQEVAEIVKQAQFRKIEDKVGDPRNRDYAKKMLELGKKYKGSSLGDLALYEAFSSLKKKRDPAFYQAGEELLSKHSDSKYAKEVVADLGNIAIQSGDYNRAADYFEKFMSLYPQDPLTKKLLLSAGALRENQGDFDKAIQHYRQSGVPFKKVADLYARAKKWRDLVQYASRHVETLAGRYYTGLSFERVGDSSNAISNLQKVTQMTAQDESEKVMVAHALFLIAKNNLKDYRDLQFGQGDDAAVTKIKADKLNSLNGVFSNVIQFGNGKWVIGSLYSLGLAHKEFADFLTKAPLPSGLTPDLITAYKQAIQAQVADYRSKASQYFKSCLENAEKYEVFTLYVRGCLSQGDYLVDESKDEVIVRKPINRETPEVKSIRASLMEKPDQIPLILSLGKIYIKNKDFGMAKLAMGRVLELQPQNDQALAYLGVIDIHNQDYSSAKDYFTKSMAANPKSDLAILGQLALYKKFQFKNLESKLANKPITNKSQYSQMHPWIDELL